MKVREFGAWPPQNAPGIKRKNSVDEFNRSFKGKQFTSHPEYASREVEEYYRVPEIKEVGPKQFDQQDDVSGSGKKKDRQGKNTNQLRQNMLRQVAGLVAGSVVITTSYQAVIQQQQQVEQPAIVQEQTDVDPVRVSTNWKWSEDNETVILEISGPDGKLIKTITAVVSVAEIPATCNKEGIKTYTATAEDGDKTYSDTRSEPLAPLGHDFDEGKVLVLEDGRTVMTFECARCHEQFTIGTSMAEND